MIKKLTKLGNSHALVIEKAILKLLKISPKTFLEVSTDGEVLIVSPIRDEKRQKRFEHALQKTNRRYGRMLKRLS